jgi:Flp pilus assembly protein TadG
VSRGQALVELALCAPVIILLTLGVAAGVQAIDARAGLEAATQAAAAEAARAPDQSSAEKDAQARFASIVAAYPLRAARLSLSLGNFNRSAAVLAVSSGTVEVGWAALVFPKTLTLESRYTVPIETWRSHRP